MATTRDPKAGQTVLAQPDAATTVNVEGQGDWTEEMVNQLVDATPYAGPVVDRSPELVMIQRQVCHFHADEDVAGVLLNADGEVMFTCERKRGHPVSGPYTWVQAPEPPDLPEVSGQAEELNLHVELPAAIAKHAAQWVEYGVVEAAHAHANPRDFAHLVDRYGHTAIRATQYSASAFLAATLGRLSRSGHVMFHDGPATGRWHYNGRISWWAFAPEPEWDTSRTSWEDLTTSMAYVPGNTE
jgi:hypothetical protein